MTWLYIISICLRDSWSSWRILLLKLRIDAQMPWTQQNKNNKWSMVDGQRAERTRTASISNKSAITDHVLAGCWLAAWHSGRTPERRTFPVPRSSCSWRVTTYYYYYCRTIVNIKCIQHNKKHTNAYANSALYSTSSYIINQGCNVGKPSATGQPTRPTQPFILPGSIDWVVTNFIGCVLVAPSGECSPG